MPNTITHLYFAKDVKKHLPEEMVNIINKHNDAYLFGSIGPDYLFALREIGLDEGRYPNLMQYLKQYEVFSEISKYLFSNRDPLLISYSLGLMCHYVADLHCHPYVNFFCEEEIVKHLRPIQSKSVHTLIESAGDEYICTKKMGYENSNKYKPNRDLRTKKKTRLAVGRMYEKVINPLFGIPLTPKKAALSVELTRIFLSIANDPRGIIRPIADKIEDKFADKKKFTALMRPPEGYGVIDYLNFENKPWRIARNREQTSDLDYIELLEVARESAVNTYIPMLFAAITKDEKLEPSLFRINYEGVDTAFIDEQRRGIASPDLPTYERVQISFEKESTESEIKEETTDLVKSDKELIGTTSEIEENNDTTPEIVESSNEIKTDEENIDEAKETVDNSNVVETDEKNTEEERETTDNSNAVKTDEENIDAEKETVDNSNVVETDEENTEEERETTDNSNAVKTDEKI